MTELFLGDGLYASFDGFSVTLRAPRERGDHYVVLEPSILRAFEEFIRTEVRKPHDRPDIDQ